MLQCATRIKGFVRDSWQNGKASYLHEKKPNRLQSGSSQNIVSKPQRPNLREIVYNIVINFRQVILHVHTKRFHIQSIKSK